MVYARVSSNESRGSSSTGNLNRTSSSCKRLPLGSPSPINRGSSMYDKPCALPYINWNRDAQDLHRYASSWSLMMRLSNNYENSWGNLWKSGSTSEIGTLSDWYFTIRTSIGSRIAMAFFNSVTKFKSVIVSLTSWRSFFWAAVPLMKSRVETIACRCCSEASRVLHVC